MDTHARRSGLRYQIERALQMLCADKVEPSEPLPKPRHRTKQTNAPKFDARGLLYRKRSANPPPKQTPSSCGPQ